MKKRKNKSSQFSPTRRNILKAGAASGALFPLSGLTVFSSRANAATLINPIGGALLILEAS